MNVLHWTRFRGSTASRVIEWCVNPSARKGEPIWLCWNPTCDLRQLMTNTSWMWNIPSHEAATQYQPCISDQHRRFLQLDISVLFLYSYHYRLWHGHPTKPTRGWEDQHVSNHFRSWQTHPAVRLGSNTFVGESEALQLTMTWSNSIPHSGSFHRVLPGHLSASGSTAFGKPLA